MTVDTPASKSATRDRVVAAAAGLLAEGGREAVSTRAVSAASGVQAPTLYRLFGDKQGLLDAVATHGLTVYLAGKTDLQPGPDPVDDLRAGWDRHVAFGLDNPAVYALIYGDPRPGASPPAAAAAAEILAAHIHRIAEAGRLKVRADRAAQLVHAAGCGTTLTLISTPEPQRDLTLSDLGREAVIDAITTDPPAPAPAAPGLIGAAVALRAVLAHQSSTLTAHEQGLLREWLDRIAVS
jgi:AcrR family transcriptional regulator